MKPRRRGDSPLCIRMLLLAMLLLLCTLGGCVKQHHAPSAVAGVIDLSHWDIASQGPASLNGQWDFYWRHLYTPGEHGPDLARIKPRYVMVPALWHLQQGETGSFSSTGYGTYHLRVLLPENSPEKLSLQVIGALSVSNVWVNGALVGGTGAVGQDADTESPKRHSVIAAFSTKTGSLENILDIVIQVSNFHNTVGGLSRAITLGTTEQIQGRCRTLWITGAFVGGAMLCLSLYHFALFYMRRRVRTYLYFALYCLLWCVATVFSPGSGLLMDVLAPRFSWEWFINMALLPYGLITPLMVLFYHGLFPKPWGKWVNGFFLTLGAVFIAYILGTPANAYDPPVFFYFLATRGAFLYLIAMFILDTFNKEDGVLLLVPGYLGLCFAEFDDVLFDRNLIGSADFGLFGILLFILTYSFFVSSRFAQAFKNVEQLSRKLETTNVRLCQLNALKDSFLANTTHELKTPLAGMVGIAEALLAGAGGKLTNAAREHLQILAHSGKRLSNLVNDVRDLSRLEHQDIMLHKGAVSLQDATAGVLALVGQLSADRNVVLQNSVPADFPLLLADSDRLEQILFNLLGNSLKFTRQGSITVTATCSDTFATVTVQDTGVGISPEDQERIFSPYEQAHNETSGAGTGGTGLGLAITRYLVELHGGEIAVSSQPGKGSVFTFTIPLHTEAAEEAIQEASALPPGAAALLQDSPVSGRLPLPLDDCTPQDCEGHCQVLVVDDEPVNLHVVTSCLQLAGITFCTANNGNAALELLEGDALPDVVLLDVMMPGVDGFEVCRRVRAKYSASALPVVMLTVRNRVEDVVQGFAAGANDYLTKPFSREELVARVGAQIELRNAYGVMVENLTLKGELSLRKKNEQRLRFMQLRLSRLLDSLDDAMVAVNPGKEICFCNKAFSQLTGYGPHQLLGRPLYALLEAPESKAATLLMDVLDGEAVAKDGDLNVVPCVLLAKAGGGALEKSVFVNDVELEDEPLTLLVVRDAAAAGENADAGAMARPSFALLQELHKSRRRVLELEESVLSLETGSAEKRQSVLEDLTALDTLLDRLSENLVATPKRPEADARRALAVQVMNQAVDCWCATAGNSKITLAEASGIWNVYLEKDGYCRTQTLDKYLSSNTLPKRPRWRDIHATAEFVLANVAEKGRAYEELHLAYASLRDLS